MHRLIPGIRAFRENVFPSHRTQFEGLASGQRPPTMFITCSDSRIVPEMLTQTGPGELFVLRNAGNMVPPSASAPSGEAATIEYAIQVLKVEDVIVCGHSHCGAIAGLLRPQSLQGLPAVEQWLTYAERVRREMEDERFVRDGDDDLLTTAIKANVLVQLDHLRSHQVVADAEARGDVHLHGCFYRFETGEVTLFDDSERRFTALETHGCVQVAGTGVAATIS